MRIEPNTAGCEARTHTPEHTHTHSTHMQTYTHTPTTHDGGKNKETTKSELTLHFFAHPAQKNS